MPMLKTTVTAIQFAIQMSYRRGCAVVLYFVLWGSGRHAGSLNMRLYSVLPSPLFSFFFFVSATFKTQRGACTSGILFFPRLTCTSQRHKLVSQKMFSMFSAKTSNVFTFYVAWGREKATLNPIWPSRLKRISRNAIWIGFQTTYECSSKRICTNRISCSSLPFRLAKYDRISIGFAQKSDLGWQSERGFYLLPANTERSPNVSFWFPFGYFWGNQILTLGKRSF